jgi:hypothetical protein
MKNSQSKNGMISARRAQRRPWLMWWQVLDLAHALARERLRQLIIGGGPNLVRVPCAFPRGTEGTPA